METDEISLIPTRMLNEFTYCPRLAYLEWVQGEFIHSVDTLEGSRIHHRVDKELGELPLEPQEDKEIHAQSVLLSSENLGIIAKIDLVESFEDEVYPVDYKKGTAIDIPGKAWEADIIQLTAQGLILKDSGYKCNKGILYYASSKERVEIELSEEYINKTKNKINEFRTIIQSREIPSPLIDSPKCPRCSLAGICLPDEINMLSAEISDEEDSEKVRRLIPARTDKIPLYVQTQGAYITKNAENLVIEMNREKIASVHLIELSQVAIFGRVQISTPAIQVLLQNEIPLLFYSQGSWFYGISSGLGHKNIELRIAQFKAAFNEEVSLKLAQRFIEAKLMNCRTMLRRNASADVTDSLNSLRELIKDCFECKTKESLLGKEGNGAKVYFQSFSKMLKSEIGFDFEGRNRRPPKDPVNALLSLGYSLLVKDFTITAMSVGFDPFLGFYHQPRYGRPALALDLMEEFRHIIVDSVVITIINNGELKEDDFLIRGGAVTLKDAGKRRFIAAYERRLETLITHPIFGYKISYRRTFEVQTRLLARYLLGEIKAYPGFKVR